MTPRSVVFDWGIDELFALAAAANRMEASPTPSWLRTSPPHVTAQSFMDDIFQVLAASSGSKKQAGSVWIGTDTPKQYAKLKAAVETLQEDAFLQRVMVEAYPKEEEGEGKLVARVAFLASSQHTYPMDIKAPEHGMRRLFV